MSKIHSWAFMPVLRSIYTIDSGYCGDYGMQVGKGPDKLIEARIVRETEQMLRKDDGSQISKHEAEYKWRDTPREAWERHREIVLLKASRLQHEVDDLLARVRASDVQIASSPLSPTRAKECDGGEG